MGNQSSPHLVTEQEILDALAEVRAECETDTANLLTAVYRGFRSLAQCTDIEAEILESVGPDGKLCMHLSMKFDSE